MKKHFKSQIVKRVGKHIYVISPFRRAFPSQKKVIENYIKKLQASNHVHSYMSVNQEDATGYNIVNGHILGMVMADEVHIFWDKSSWGCHVDLGMALSLKKPLKLIKSFSIDERGKSYLKAIKEIEEHGYSVAKDVLDVVAKPDPLPLVEKKEEKKKEEKNENKKKPTKRKPPGYSRIF